MSGWARSRNRSTAGSLARSEFRFHVAIRSRAGAGPAGDSEVRKANAVLRRSNRAARFATEGEISSPTSPTYPITARPSQRLAQQGAVSRLNTMADSFLSDDRRTL